MRKKDEMLDRRSKAVGNSTLKAKTPTVPSRTPELTVIARSIEIKGEVTGDEDLLIEGRVEGSVDLRTRLVTVGPEGDVKASILGRVVSVEGRVQGNLTAEKKIVLLSSASVEGDLVAPRVVLEDGASFRGGINTGAAGKSPGKAV